jgi:hypothetical protein
MLCSTCFNHEGVQLILIVRAERCRNIATMEYLSRDGTSLAATDDYDSQPGGIFTFVGSGSSSQYRSIIVITVAAVADKWSGRRGFWCSCRSNAL